MATATAIRPAGEDGGDAGGCRGAQVTTAVDRFIWRPSSLADNKGFLRPTCSPVQVGSQTQQCAATTDARH
jgi:hypothetical protein